MTGKTAISSVLIVWVAAVLGSFSALPAMFYGISAMWGVALQLGLITLWAFVLTYFVVMWEDRHAKPGWRFKAPHEWGEYGDEKAHATVKRIQQDNA